jgi:hypothetical protein
MQEVGKENNGMAFFGQGFVYCSVGEYKNWQENTVSLFCCWCNTKTTKNCLILGTMLRYLRSKW